MSLQCHFFRAAACACFSLPILLATGCSDDGTVTVNANATPLARGNWQVSSSAGAAARLPAISGAFTASGSTITATVHAQAASACISPASSFTLTGTEDAKNNITLTGGLNGGTLTLTGVLAADGKSLTGASYTVKGGSCAISDAVSAVAQSYSAVTGNYTGSFADIDGQVATVSANLSQSSAPDANGNFTLAGTATVVGDPCFPSPVSLTSTQVTGGTFTYTMNANGSTIVANGSFSPDAGTLTVTSWTSSGTCGADTGVQSTMTRQGS